MKKLILAAVSILFLLVIALLVGPSFIDWNKYKEQIITQAEKTSGYKIDISGDLSLSVLPRPKLKIEGLVVEAPAKIKFENLVDVKSAEVSVELMPLLQKELVVDKITLVSPVINLEVFKNGQGSWVSTRVAMVKGLANMRKKENEINQINQARKAKQTASDVMRSIALNKLEIKDGEFSFFDHKKDVLHNLKNINITLNAKTLNGPYDFDGGLNYNGKDIKIDLGVGEFNPTRDSISVNGVVSLVKEKIKIKYDGLVATSAPIEAQGQVKIVLDSGIPSITGQKVSVEGILNAGEDKIEINDLIGFLGKARANGKFSISNFKQKNPVNVIADLKFNQDIDLSSIKTNSAPKKSASNNSENAISGNNPKKNNSGFIPSSITLPMAIDAQITLDAPGIKIDDKEFKGVFLSVIKKGGKSTVTAKALQIPGQGKAEGSVDIAFASSSVSKKSGAVTYVDPSVSYVAQGNVGQIEKALSVFAPQIDKKAAQMFKTAQFDLKGSLSSNSISLKDSVLKLDQTSIGLGGRYTKSNGAGKPKAVVDLSIGDIDIDSLMGKKIAISSDVSSSSTSSKSSVVNSNKVNAKSGGLKNSLKPLQEFNIPLDLTFDLSVQKARLNGVSISGVRVTGQSVGNKLTLKNSSINDYQGATLSANGVIGNRSDLSDLDMVLGLKTKDIQGFAKSMKIDASKLPSTLKSVDANVALKGSINEVNMDAAIKAMGGQLDVAGFVKDALGNPQMSDMRIGLKHPNFSQAIKVISPDFKGGAGLSQAVNFSTKANTSGKIINLSDLKATLGTSSFAGNLKLDQSGSKPSVTGKIQAGTIALDKMLGAKSSGSKSSTSSGGVYSSSKTSASGGSSSSKSRWSKDPINVDWLNNINVNLDLAANAINYGAWNFVKPSTVLKINNGELDVESMKAVIFGGQAVLNANVKAPAKSGEAISLNIDSSMNGISLEALAYALSKSKKLKSSGTVAFNFDVNSNGASAYQLINALDGKANLDGRDIIIKGFDLNKMARGLAVEEKLANSVNSLLDGALSGGQTKFDTIKGDYKITEGVVKINSMAMDSEISKIDSTGYVSLPEWKINTDHKITLKNVPDLAPFNVKIKGALDNPTNTFGKKVLQDYLGAKLKRKLAKELPDVLGSDVTDTLKGLGVLPKDTSPVAPDTSAQPNSANTTPSSDAVTPNAQPVAPAKQAPVHKKIEKPEDALKELLNSDNPEDAVGNVLKGLF